MGNFMCIRGRFTVVHNRVTENSWLSWMTVICSHWQVQIRELYEPERLRWFVSGKQVWPWFSSVVWVSLPLSCVFYPSPGPERFVEMQSSFSNYSAKFALTLYPCRAKTALPPSSQLLRFDTTWKRCLARKVAWPCAPWSRAAHYAVRTSWRGRKAALLFSIRNDRKSIKLVFFKST